MKRMDLKQFHKLGKKIVGAAVNYRSMQIEKKSPDLKEPLFFLKPTTSYITEENQIIIPEGCKVNYEVELGVIIGKSCKGVKAEEADEYIAGYCLALDLTATNLIDEARKNGYPWTLGKGFDTATPVSRAVEKSQVPSPTNVRLWCSVNGEMRQDSTTSEMIFPTNQLIQYSSQYMTLEPYDVILTGSPAGVGPIKSGDCLAIGLGDVITAQFKVK